MKNKSKDQIIKEIHEHGVKMGFINGYRETEPKRKKPNNKK